VEEKETPIPLTPRKKKKKKKKKKGRKCPAALSPAKLPSIDQEERGIIRATFVKEF